MSAGVPLIDDEMFGITIMGGLPVQEVVDKHRCLAMRARQCLNVDVCLVPLNEDQAFIGVSHVNWFQIPLTTRI